MKLHTKSSYLAFLIGVLALLLPAVASSSEQVKRFDATAFAEAQKAGKSILVNVHAPWCTTCKVQKTALAAILVKPEFKDVVVFDIDFDGQKDDWKALKAQSRSTLIVFKGATETGRSVSDTNPDSIEALIKGAL